MNENQIELLWISYCILLCLFQKKFRFVVCKSMLLENVCQQHQNEIWMRISDNELVESMLFPIPGCYYMNPVWIAGARFPAVRRSPWSGARIRRAGIWRRSAAGCGRCRPYLWRYAETGRFRCCPWCPAGSRPAAGIHILKRVSHCGSPFLLAHWQSPRLCLQKKLSSLLIKGIF